MTINLRPADWVTLHARLLASRELRRLLRQDQAGLARWLDWPPNELQTFARLNPDDLDRQARGLVEKRWHEVRRLIPRTVRRLGPEGKQLFEIYADTHWPEGHRRHLLDARMFLEQLRQNDNQLPDAAEAARIRFSANACPLAIHFHKRLGCGVRSGPGIQVLWRRGGVHERGIFLVLPQLKFVMSWCRLWFKASTR
jgi:hypothetical protein